MNCLFLILMSLSGGLEGPIDDLYNYAGVQEAYLLEIGSYTAEIRQVREVFRVHPESGQESTTVSQETLKDKTIIGGGRFTVRSTEMRRYTTDGTEVTKHVFSHLLADDLIAELRSDEPLKTVRVQKMASAEEMPPDGRRMKGVMNPRDILVHGFGDGNRTLRTLCDDVLELSTDHAIKIDVTPVENGRLNYSIAKDGKVYEEFEVDPQRLGMVSRVRLFNPKSDYRLVLEVRVTLGQLPDGRPFPTLWHHIEYDTSSEPTDCGKVRSSTRNELLSVVPSSVEPADVTFRAFDVPDGTPAIIKDGYSETLRMGSIQAGALVEGAEP